MAIHVKKTLITLISRILLIIRVNPRNPCFKERTRMPSIKSIKSADRKQERVSPNLFIGFAELKTRIYEASTHLIREIRSNERGCQLVQFV